MHAEIIALGDEITSGQLLDTNTQWLSLRLEELGIRVLYHTTVGDRLDAMRDVFRQAIDRADVVVATGGLGPTADDLTRQAIAEATGRRLVMDADALAHVRAVFGRRKREMPSKNEVQGMLPEGGRMIDNPHGTAPGVELEIPRDGRAACQLFAVPGVPAEMREMWYGTLESALRKSGGGRSLVRHRNINCFGAGESQVEAMLPDLIRRGREPRVGITASRTTIILRITAQGATEEECYAVMEPTVATIHECLGSLVFGEGDDELQHVVCRLLRQQGQSLATAEWGTGGMVADWLSEVSESQGAFYGGLVVANAESAQRALEIDATTLKPNSAANEATAAAMAVACRDRYGTDYGLAVGPFPEHEPRGEAPRPFYLALATADGVTTKAHPYAGHPAMLKILCAKRALNLARLALQGDD